MLNPNKPENVKKSHLEKEFLSDTLPKIMQKDAFCFLNFPTFLFAAL